MEDAARFRGLLKSEEDAVSWVRHLDWGGNIADLIADRPSRMG